MSIKLISLNIETDTHFDRILPFVLQEHPDIICFNEVFEADVAMLKHAFGMNGVFAPAQSVDRPNKFRIQPRGVTGSLILSAGEISSTTTQYYYGTPDTLPELTDEAGDAANRFLLWAEILCGGVLYRVVTTHFTVTERAQITDKQRTNLAAMMKLLESHQEFIFCGDFNSPRGGEIFDTLAAHYKDNIPGGVVTTLDPTIHRAGNNLPNIVVDGLFTTQRYVATNVRVLSGLSDHCAIVASIHERE